MNDIVKYGLKFLGTHVLALGVTMLCVLSFSWLFSYVGIFWFSILTGGIYTIMLYSDAWNYGRLDAKPYNDVKATPVRALLSSLLPSAVGLVLILIRLFGIDVTFAAKLWYMMFMGLYPNTATMPITLLQLVCTVAFTPAVAAIGYAVGTTEFSLFNLYAAKRREYIERKTEEQKAQRKKKNS